MTSRTLTLGELREKRKRVYEDLAQAVARLHEHPSSLYRSGVSARIAALEREAEALDRKIERLAPSKGVPRSLAMAAE